MSIATNKILGLWSWLFATSIRVPRADYVTPSQVSILEPFAGNFTRNLLGAL